MIDLTSTSQLGAFMAGLWFGIACYWLGRLSAKAYYALRDR